VLENMGESLYCIDCKTYSTKHAKTKEQLQKLLVRVLAGMVLECWHDPAPWRTSGTELFCDMHSARQ
jgi:hypothetical protein